MCLGRGFAQLFLTWCFKCELNYKWTNCINTGPKEGKANFLSIIVAKVQHRVSPPSLVWVSAVCVCVYFCPWPPSCDRPLQIGCCVWLEERLPNTPGPEHCPSPIRLIPLCSLWVPKILPNKSIVCEMSGSFCGHCFHRFHCFNGIFH